MFRWRLAEASCNRAMRVLGERLFGKRTLRGLELEGVQESLLRRNDGLARGCPIPWGSIGSLVFSWVGRKFGLGEQSAGESWQQMWFVVSVHEAGVIGAWSTSSASMEGKQQRANTRREGRLTWMGGRTGSEEGQSSA